MRILIFLVFLLVSQFAHAGGGSIPEKGIKSGSRQVETKMWPVGTYLSEPGEGKEAFLLRVAAEAQAWTQANDAETCAFIATDGERFGLRLLTLRSQVDCVFAYDVAPAGMKTTAETFHTHPAQNRGGYIELSDATRKSMRELGDLERHAKPKWAQVENKNEFSKRDLEAGPGYLVTEGRLLYQDGSKRAKTREVGQVGQGDGPSLAQR